MIEEEEEEGSEVISSQGKLLESLIKQQRDDFTAFSRRFGNIQSNLIFRLNLKS